MLRSILPFGLALLSVACGGAAVTPAQTPAERPATEPAPSAEAAPGKATKSGLGPMPDGVPDAPSECQAFVVETKAKCATGSFEPLLADALSVGDATDRDARLRCLEAAPAAPPGLVRALRAELAPRQCGDLIVGPDATVPGAARELGETLLALGSAARLYRSVRQPPLPHPPFNKPDFLRHFKQVLSPWIVTQAHAVDALSQVGPRLSGYARGIVALEAGLADMRFVGVARAIELPDEMKADPEIRDTYLVELERALEPRVARGRDAALVGLGELSRQGVTNDARLGEARHLLSELFAGRRIDALDKLLLPPLAPATLDSPALVLAAKLPAFYALKLAASPNVDDAKLLRARLEQGVPPALWLGASAKALSPELMLLQQRALFQLGQTYFWAEPFARAAASEVPGADSGAALLAALAHVLSRGPRNAAALMLGPTTLPPELRDTASVDALAKQPGPIAGLAEFDAAYLRSLSPPANDPAFWKEQAARYRRAQKHLDPDRAALAGELAKAATDTENALRKAPKP